MKKFLGFLAIVLVIAVVVILLIMKFGFGAGIGTGSGDGNGDSESESSAAVQEESSNEEACEKPEHEILEITSETGEKADSDEGTIFEVSVVKSEYFYKNKSISLDDLVDEICAVDGKLVVKITDDNAALNPYNKLIEKLDALDISYVEMSIN